MPTNSVIAIDGPPASGKTTVGKALAHRLGYHFLDTGLLYRALTWWLLQNGTDLSDIDAIAQHASEAELTLRPDQASWSVFVGAQALGEADLRSAEVEKAVSLVSAVPAVREQLREFQRQLARDGRIVIAGQDIGSVVLPDAKIKVFLDASLEERVRRRSAQSKNQNDIASTLVKRSELDAARAVSPLEPAPDAHRIETDNLTAQEVVDRIAELVERKDW